MLVCEAGSPARSRMRARWHRLERRFPLVSRMVDLWVLDEGHLPALRGSSYATFGLERGDAAFLGLDASRDDAGFLTRPGLLGPMAGLRRLRGPERLPVLDRPAAAERRIAAWLELQFWWRHAFDACVRPERAHVPSLCGKLVAEPARIWLLLARDEHHPDREAVLRRALALFPEEEAALRLALALLRRPGTRRPCALETVLPTLVRLSTRVAERVLAEVEPAGTTDVRLIHGAAEELVPAGDARGTAQASALPLVDWRALALGLPGLPDEAFALADGDPADRETVRRLAEAGQAGVHPCLRSGPLLLLPTAEIWRRAFLRAVQCRATDPVSFALTAGARAAGFPDVPGWSIRDVSRRALAELGAWLRLEPGREPPRVRGWLGPQPHPAEPTPAALGLLFAAARAALLAESLEAGRPELHLTVAAVAGALADRGHEAASPAAADYRECRSAGADPPPAAFDALRRAVRSLPALSEWGRTGRSYGKD